MFRNHVLISSLCAFACGALSIPAEARPGQATGQTTGTFSGQVFIGAGPDRRAAPAGVVVYFESAPELDDSAEQLRARAQNVYNIDQKNEQFLPRMVVIPRGSTIAFPNQDRVFHNVFSLSKTKRFDLGLYRDGESRSVTFKRTGVVDVFCNIHPKMAARVMVVPNRFYALTDSQGRFSLADVPAGTYTAVAWNGSDSRATVTIRAGQDAAVAIELSPASRRKRHQRKDGTPYRRYR